MRPILTTSEAPKVSSEGEGFRPIVETIKLIFVRILSQDIRSGYNWMAAGAWPCVFVDRIFGFIEPTNIKDDQ